MAKKKHRKERDSSSSDESSSSSSSSSSNSSESSDGDDRKRQSSNKKPTKNFKTKFQKEEANEDVKKNAKHSRSSDNVRLEAEQSKWDSPDEKSKRESRKPDKPPRHSELPSTYRVHSSQHTENGEYSRHYRSSDNRQSSHSKTHSKEDRRDRNRPADTQEEYHRSHDHYSGQANTSNSDKRDYRTKRDGRRSEERYRRDDKDSHRSSDRKYQARDERRHERPSRDNRNDYHGSRFNKNKRRRSRSSSFNHKEAKWGKEENQKQGKGEQAIKEKDKPNFGLSGKLTEETNTFRGIVIKYSEPPEARKPKRRWRLYPFKGDKALQTLYIHRESAYLIGRERKVVDLPVDHPSCSKQHAVLQYRLVPFTRDDGSTGKKVRPYLIDLESANGTFINNKKIDAKRYIELLEKDVIKFGFSSREYVLLHENSKDEADDDDVKDEEVTENVKKEKD